MEEQKQLKPFLYFFSFFSFLAGIQVVQCMSHHHHHHHHHHNHPGFQKLFVFGDSYADTGNTKISISSSWKTPYGITFPGKPAGRFSNGRVLTDYIASFIRIKSPIPYKWRKIGMKKLQYGMNLAYGGTGVFNTLVLEPNMTTQIDFFQQLIKDGVYTKSDLSSAVALVSLAGNDYSAYNSRNGTAQDLPAFISTVINQLALNLKRVHDLGVRKVAVTAMEPIGCLPDRTASSSYQQCSETDNKAILLHNALLKEAVKLLNNEIKDSAFIILDLYDAFMSVFNRHESYPGSLQFDNPLKPCCMGISNEYRCGSIDANGVKKYTVCEKPDSAFFWDGVHPSQEGWHAVYSALQASLYQL